MIIISCILFCLIIGISVLYIHNRRQIQHSVLRNYPLLGMFRKLENLGPEMRQYFTNSDTEGTPFSRVIMKQLVLMGKYMHTTLGFGSQRDFTKPGWFINNAIFCTPEANMAVDNSKTKKTWVYKILKEHLLVRNEVRTAVEVKPYLLRDPIVIGDNDPLVKLPWKTNSFIGQSAMSYGALGDHAIETLAHGLTLGETWANTGEGGLSEHHLVGDNQIIFQFGPGMFGCRNGDAFSYDKYAETIAHERVVATEIKFAQGAKIQGGMLKAAKNTPKVAAARGIQPGIDVDSPNCYPFMQTPEELTDFMVRLKTISGKPVGIKIVVGGDPTHVEDLIATFAKHHIWPSYIVVDGSEGGTGAAPQDMADSMGIPVLGTIPIVDHLLKQYGLRDKVKIFASGKLMTADQVVIALALGADCINIARGMMVQLGCFQALECDKGSCPTGVATQDPRLQDGLVIIEKAPRVGNFCITLRKHAFAICAAIGIHSPIELRPKHVCYQDASGHIINGQDWYDIHISKLFRNKKNVVAVHSNN